MAPPRPYLLVVDDWMDTADSLIQLLTVWGYDAESRYCGESALTAAAVRRPQAILLDVGMPKMNGFEFIARYRELPGGVSTAIILVSGHADATTHNRAREMGIAHYLIKPADPSEIRTLLETLTRRGRPVGGIRHEWAGPMSRCDEHAAMSGAQPGLARHDLPHTRHHHRKALIHPNAHQACDIADSLLPHTATGHSPTCG